MVLGRFLYRVTFPGFQLGIMAPSTGRSTSGVKEKKRKGKRKPLQFPRPPKQKNVRADNLEPDTDASEEQPRVPSEIIRDIEEKSPKQNCQYRSVVSLLVSLQALLLFEDFPA